MTAMGVKETEIPREKKGFSRGFYRKNSSGSETLQGSCDRITLQAFFSVRNGPSGLSLEEFRAALNGRGALLSWMRFSPKRGRTRWRGSSFGHAQSSKQACQSHPMRHCSRTLHSRTAPMRATCMSHWWYPPWHDVMWAARMLPVGGEYGFFGKRYPYQFGCNVRQLNVHFIAVSEAIRPRLSIRVCRTARVARMLYWDRCPAISSQVRKPIAKRPRQYCRRRLVG